MGVGQHGQDLIAGDSGERLVDAAGHHPCGMDALAAERFDNGLAEVAQADAVAGEVGVARPTPKKCGLLGSASKPISRSGEDRWKKLRACDCTIWARFRTRRRLAAVGELPPGRRRTPWPKRSDG